MHVNISNIYLLFKHVFFNDLLFLPEDFISPDEKEVVLLEWLKAAGMVW